MTGPSSARLVEAGQKAQHLYFINRRDAQAEQAVRDQLPKGHLIHYINLRNMWQARPSWPVHLSGYARDFGVSRQSLKRTLDAVARQNGHRAIQSKDKFGSDEGYRLIPVGQVAETVTPSSPTQEIAVTGPLDDHKNTTGTPLDSHVLSICGQSAADLQQGDVATSTGGADMAAGGVVISTGGCSYISTSKTSNKQEINTDRPRELSPVADAPRPSSKKISQFLKEAEEAAVKQDQRLGLRDRSITAASRQTWHRVIRDQQLSEADVEKRITNLFSWLASQHWMNGRPYARELGPAFTAHLKGYYPEPPSDDPEAPDCHAEQLVTCEYRAGRFLIFCPTTGHYDGSVGELDQEPDESGASVPEPQAVRVPLPEERPAPDPHQKPISLERRQHAARLWIDAYQAQEQRLKDEEACPPAPTHPVVAGAREKQLEELRALGISC